MEELVDAHAELEEALAAMENKDKMHAELEEAKAALAEKDKEQLFRW